MTDVLVVHVEDDDGDLHARVAVKVEPFRAQGHTTKQAVDHAAVAVARKYGMTAHVPDPKPKQCANFPDDKDMIILR